MRITNKQKELIAQRIAKKVAGNYKSKSVVEQFINLDKSIIASNILFLAECLLRIILNKQEWPQGLGKVLHRRLEAFGFADLRTHGALERRMRCVSPHDYRSSCTLPS